MNKSRIVFNKKANTNTKPKIITNSNVAKYTDSVKVEIVALNSTPLSSKERNLKAMERMVAKEYGATPGRKRPRNPQEREVLLRWEQERGGIKIGTI